MMEHGYLFLIPLLPLLGAIINGALSMATSNRNQGPNEAFSGTIAVLSVAISFGLTLYLNGTLSFIHTTDPALHQHLWTWFSVAGLDVSFSLYFDHLTSMMLMFITGIGALIHLYSIGYMKGDRGFARFMCYLNLFMFSMIMLVIGDNPLVTFLGWEGVGLCSYLLIGFWHHDHENNDAARKAFITNRVGDLAFLLGIFVLYYAMQQWQSTSTVVFENTGFSFHAISQWAMAAAVHGLGDFAPHIAVATFLIFFGCTAKSAQIPLMTWLPDAMAGPTPVSALIHAATMVTAGVFLVCRMSDVFVLADSTMTLITIVGILTALYAAICAMFQWDIKKVLAYSTVSQLGFMFMAVGVGAFDVALFHVFTHAFFKATLFLGAGSVIHSLHHEQDMRRMGQLDKRMPFTRVAMLFAWWAICGLPLGAGFMSKDLILERLFFFDHTGTFAMVMWILAIIAAGLTAYYMTRLIILTFYSNDRVDHEHLGEVKEAPFIMTLPVVLLGFGSFAAGIAWCDAVLVWFVGFARLVGFGKEVSISGDELDNMRWLPTHLEPALHQAAEGSLYAAGNADEHLGMIIVLALIGVTAAIIGCVVAWVKFRNGLEGDNKEVKPLAGFGKSWTFIFDTCYDMLIVRPIVALSQAIYKFVDQLILANLIKGIGVAVHYIGDGCRGIQRGQLRISMALSLLAVIILFVVVIFGSY